MLTSFTVNPVTQTAEVAVNIPSIKFVPFPLTVTKGKERIPPPINITMKNTLSFSTSFSSF